MFPRITLRAASSAAILVVLLAGCGKEDVSSGSSPVAARVNGDEISEQQVDFALARLGRVPPEQVKVASRQLVEQLIDRQLLTQKAMEKKLDQDPDVKNALEAARREVLARAYMEKAVTSGATRPSAEDVKKHYAANPGLFAERRVYHLQELGVKIKPDFVPALSEQIAKAASLDDVVGLLRAGNIAFNANAATRAAEQLPAEALPRVSKMKDGDIIVMQIMGQTTILQLVASQPSPLTEAVATPQIEVYLLNQKKSELAAAELKQLRQSAKLAYEGRFAETAAAPGAAAPQVAAPVGAVADRKEQQAKN